MKSILMLVIAIFLIPFLVYIFRCLGFYKRSKDIKSCVHSFKAFDRLKNGDFEIKELRYPLVLLSGITTFFIAIAGLVFLFLMVSAIYGLRLDTNMDIQANTIFNYMFALCVLCLIVYLLSISTLIVIEDKCLKFNNHLLYFLTFGVLKGIAYSDINQIEININFGKERSGTYSIGTELIIDSIKNKLKLKPNILYNNETLVLIAGLRDKLKDKVKITKV